MNQYALLLRGIQESEHMLPTFLNAVFCIFYLVLGIPNWHRERSQCQISIHAL